MCRLSWFYQKAKVGLIWHDVASGIHIYGDFDLVGIHVARLYSHMYSGQITTIIFHGNILTNVVKKKNL